MVVVHTSEAWLGVADQSFTMYVHNYCIHGPCDLHPRHKRHPLHQEDSASHCEYCLVEEEERSIERQEDNEKNDYIQISN